MPKSEIHPNWFPDSEVKCEGKTLCVIGSTKPQLQVDVWEGDHANGGKGPSLLGPISTEDAGVVRNEAS
mgnify:CR=1 FL=1